MQTIEEYNKIMATLAYNGIKVEFENMPRGKTIYKITLSEEQLEDFVKKLPIQVCQSDA